MCTPETSSPPEKVHPGRTRFGTISLFLGLLTIGVVAGGFSLIVHLANEAHLELEPAGNLVVVISILASILATAGFAIALRGIRSGSSKKIGAILGLLINGLLLLAGGFYSWQMLRINHMLPRVEGVFLINERPALGAELYLTEKCLHEQVWEDPSTWCYNDYAHGAQVLKDGSFAFKGLKPGEYAFHAALEQPPEGDCVSAHPHIEITNNDPWWDFDAEVLFIRVEQVSLLPGIGSSTFLDLALDCYQVSRP